MATSNSDLRMGFPDRLAALMLLRAAAALNGYPCCSATSVCTALAGRRCCEVGQADQGARMGAYVLETHAVAIWQQVLVPQQLLLDLIFFF